MFILGLQGSPRKKGNTAWLLSRFMTAAEQRGAISQTVDVCRRHIEPCKELVVCEKRGFCPIDDDMEHHVYPLLRRADVVVAASPVFFYNVTAQLKALIDRSQTLWARKYRLKLQDPGGPMRRGVMLSVGATAGKQLFDGVHLTAKYFFDAVAARYSESLTYHHIEHRDDMEKHPTVAKDVERAAERVLKPFAGRKRVLFFSKENTCRSQMAWAYARYLAGAEIEAVTGGSNPGRDVDALMAEAMAEDGIDMAFCTPKSLDAALMEGRPDKIVAMDDEQGVPEIPGAAVEAWHLPRVNGGDAADIRSIRDAIKSKAVGLADGL